MSNFFPSTVMRPNPDCVNAHCRQRQALYKGWKPYVWERVTQSTEPVNHDDEEDWGIDIEPSDDDAAADEHEEGGASSGGGASTSGSSAVAGLVHAYEKATPVTAAESASNGADVPEESMEDMMAQLEALNE